MVYMAEEFSVLRLMEQVPDEASAYLLMEKLRWGDTPVCPHCGSTAVNYIRPINGTSRRTRTGAPSQRRVWKCQVCPGRKQFSVLTGTIFHGTKIPVRTWVLVIFEMCASKNGVAAREIERKYDLSTKSAWFMLHRIREAMKREPLAGMLRGTVVADETFIGGKPKNKHRQGRAARLGGRGPGGHAHMQPVLTLVDKTTGEARSHVVADVSGATLRKVIAEQVDMGGSTLHTDGGVQYRAMGQEFIDHQFVDHSRYEYVRGDVSTNKAENFFSQLKRSIDGTHHHVSREHLHRYLGEFDYRYSTKEQTDTQRMQRLMGQTAGRRMTYRPLTGR